MRWFLIYLWGRAGYGLYGWGSSQRICPRMDGQKGLGDITGTYGMSKLCGMTWASDSDAPGQKQDKELAERW